MHASAANMHLPPVTCHVTCHTHAALLSVCLSLRPSHSRMAASNTPHELDKALDAAIAESSHRPSVQILGVPSKLLPAQDNLDFNLARDAAVRAYQQDRHNPARAQAGDHLQGEDADACWAKDNTVAWTVADSLKPGFHRKYCTELFTERANTVCIWMHQLVNEHFCNLESLLVKDTVLVDLGCGPGCSTLGYAQFVCQTFKRRLAFKAFGMDTDVEWIDGFSALDLDCDFVVRQVKRGVSLEGAPGVIGILLDPHPSTDRPVFEADSSLRDTHVRHHVAHETTIVIIINMAHAYNDFVPSQAWWGKVKHSLRGRRAIILVLDCNVRFDLPAPSIRSNGKIHRSLAGATFMNFIPTERRQPTHNPSASSQPLPAVQSASKPLCPRCSARMIQRTSGGRLWGCTNFPICHGTRNILPSTRKI